MVYVPITYIPDGPVTKALKRRVRGRRPKPDLGNLGPLLDENFQAARSHGHLRYRRDDLRMLKGVADNPEVVDDGFEVLGEALAAAGIAFPDREQPEAPYYPDTRAVLKNTAILALAMVVAITAAVVTLQNSSILWMVVAIVAVSVAGAVGFAVILHRCVIRVGPLAGDA